MQALMRMGVKIKLRRKRNRKVKPEGLSKKILEQFTKVLSIPNSYFNSIIRWQSLCSLLLLKNKLLLIFGFSHIKIILTLKSRISIQILLLKFIYTKIIKESSLKINFTFQAWSLSLPNLIHITWFDSITRDLKN